MRQELFLNCLLAAIAAGIFCAQIFTPSMQLLVPTALITLVSAAVILRFRPNFSAVFFIFLFFTTGALRFQAVDRLPPNDISNFADQELLVVGRVIDAPDAEPIDLGSYRVRFNVEVDEVETRAGNFNASGKIRISARSSEPPSARIDDRIEAFGKLSRPINYNNPGQIDTVMLLKSDGITARMVVSKSNVRIESIDDGSLSTIFFRAMADVRQHYRELLDQSMPTTDSAAIFAMLFGGYGGLRKELIDAFTTVGLVHILSVSGSHISILAAAAGALAAILKLRRAWKFALGFILIVSYAVLSGCVPPVIRSAATGCLTFFALAFGCQREAKRLLTITAIFMLLHNPLLLFHISFQLSMTATAGILYLTPPIVRAFERFNPDNKKIRAAMITSIACTLGATILPQPVVAWYFNQLSISSLLANLIVTPILEFIIVVGLAAGLIAFILPPLAKLICVGLSLLFGAAYELTALIAKLPASSVFFPTLQPLAAALYYIAIFAFLHFNQRRVLIAKIVVTVIVVGVMINRIDRGGELEVHFIDVHQGDCALVITPHRHGFLIDTGGVREQAFDIGGRVVVPYLKHFGVRQLDYIFLTHSHEDHCAAVGSILQKIPVECIITSNEPRYLYANSFGMSESDSALNVLRPALEHELFTVDGVKIEVIYAPEYVGNSGGNEFSNVYRVSFGNASFLFTGDLEVDGEKRLLDRNIKSTVLKVGHHGSMTSSSEEFIRAVEPRYAVFCVGADNRFEHPRSKIVERFAAAGVSIKRTDLDGAIVFSTDGSQLRVSTYK